MQLISSNGYAFNHDFEYISVPTQIWRSVLEICGRIDTDQRIFLSPSIVINIKFFGEIVFSIDHCVVCFSLFIIISVSIELDALSVGLNVLPLFIKIFQDLHRLRKASSHLEKLFNLYQAKLTDCCRQII